MREKKRRGEREGEERARERKMSERAWDSRWREIGRGERERAIRWCASGDVRVR